MSAETVDEDHWIDLPRRQSACWLAAENIWGDKLPVGLTVADRDVNIGSWLAQR
jgi:hypothetical protein